MPWGMNSFEKSFWKNSSNGPIPLSVEIPYTRCENLFGMIRLFAARLQRCNDPAGLQQMAHPYTLTMPDNLWPRPSDHVQLR